MRKRAKRGRDPKWQSHALLLGCRGGDVELTYLLKEAGGKDRQNLLETNEKLRGALAAAQLINYHERFAFSAKMLRLLGRVFRDGSRHLAAECVETRPRHCLGTS